MTLLRSLVLGQRSRTGIFVATQNGSGSFMEQCKMARAMLGTIASTNR